jgi:hypothetical protein
MLLVQQALQAKALRDNLKALQQTQPQLTQLTHNVRQGGGELLRRDYEC